MNQILRATPLLFVLFGFSACLSEPLSRNFVRILFIIFFAALLTKKISLRDFAPYSKILLLITAFMAWLGISYISGGMAVPLTHNSIEWLPFSHDMLIFLLVAAMIPDKKFLPWILVALGLSLMIDNVYVFWQALQGVDRPQTFLRGSWMQGTMLYVILLPTFLVAMLRDDELPARRIFFGGIFFVSLAAFVLLNTRGAWLDLAIVLPIVLFCRFKSRKKFLASVMILVALGGMFLIASPRTFERLQTFAKPTSEQSVSERFLMWRSAFHAIEDNPLTGVGLGNYEAQYREKYILDAAKEREQGHAHNVYLQFWAETGLPGVILFCGLFSYVLYLSWKSWRRSRNFYGLMLFASTLDLVLYGLTDYTFASFSAMRVYWLLFGICAVTLEHR